jgi:indolepyruvate decarboxylase
MPTVGQFLIDRIQKLTDCVFGIPGDYNLNFYNQLHKKMKVINTTDEQCAGFAADAYARCRGFGVVSATYCVGGFKLVNPIAGAFAEKSPVLFISGSPGIKERDSEILLHHMVGAFEAQHKVFENITCASTILKDPSWAGYEIDRVILAMHQTKQPGYIELPRDIVDRNIKYDVYDQGMPELFKSNEENLTEAVENAIERITNSRNPVILAGVEVARFDLGKMLVKFAENTNIPIACSLLGKSVVNERHPLFAGVYCGGMSKPEVKKLVEESDCVLMLGVMQTDMNLAFQPLKCDQTNVISVNTNRCRVRRCTYEGVGFEDFIKKLCSVKICPKITEYKNILNVSEFVSKSETTLTSERLFEKINSILDDNMAIIADVGDSLFGAADLSVHHRNYFLASAFYASMGFAVPAALGVNAANQAVRPIVLVGDGSFQMTGMELSTIVKHGYRPIIFILNNHGYTTERFLLDGEFNDIQNWNYHKIVDVINGGKGYLVRTEGDLDNAIKESLLNKQASVIEILLEKKDTTPALKRMVKNLSSKI